MIPVLPGAVPKLARDAARFALNPWVQNLAREIVGPSKGLDAASRLLTVVQERVRFEPDPGGRELFRKPWETWARGAGDCDDSSVLLASLASAAGLPAELVPMGLGGAPSHVAAKVLGEWAETTLRGARLGEHPGAALARLGPSRVTVSSSSRRARSQGFIRRPRTIAALGAVSPDFVARATSARITLTAAWSKATGRAPTRFELLWALVWSKIDTSWGRGWQAPCADPVKCSCNCAGSNNWGAVQATGSQESCPWADRHQDGSSYCQGFRTYPDAVTGAADFVRHLVILRPETAKALARVASVREVCLTMIREHYFGGFCENAIKAGHTKESPECQNEAADLATLRAHAEVSVICDALGWPLPRLRDNNPRVAYYDSQMTGSSSSGGGLAALAVGALALGAGYVVYQETQKRG